MVSRLVFVPRQRLHLPPPAVLALIYVLLVLSGTVLLMLPWATHVPLGWNEALFTATSAVTVTGLIVAETGRDFTLFGQGVILALIQLGGLGVMTFAVLILSLLGMHVGLPHQSFLRDDLNQTSLADLMRLIKVILRLVVVCELAGTVLLAFVFVPAFGWSEGLWQALFHAVSAFNNAGFSLFADSLSGFATHPLLNLAVPALVLLGGIGFSVVADLWQVRGWRRTNLHTKLMLVGTAGLIGFAFLVFAALEWHNPATLGQWSSPADKLQVAWFQAITPRTAGFNTVNMAATHDSTGLLLICLMLIGGGSTSTAGGIKVTSFLVLLLATIAFFKRRRSMRAFGRSLGLEEVYKVLALTVVSLLTVMTALFLLTLFQQAPFLDLAFETASAFATVGLSRGVTGELGPAGQAVIMATMFIGRVGPLTLGFFLATRVPPRLRYPPGQVHIG